MPDHGRHLVFVGAGHAHLHPLSRAAEFVSLGGRVTLVAPGRFWYSGMGPGMVSGYYSPQEDTVDAGKLVEEAGGTFLRDRVVEIDAGSGCLHLEKGAPVRYDLLSLNVGSEVPLERIRGASEFGLPVKPIKNLVRLRSRLLDWQAADETIRIVIVGGGAAGCELGANLLQVALARQLRAAVTLVCAGDRLLSDFPARASSIMPKFLESNRVEVRLGKSVERVAASELLLEGGDRLPFHVLVMATGIRPPEFLRGSGLAVDDGGALMVNEALQSVSHTNVFGAGDCIRFGARGLPRVGVYAVRQSVLLHENLKLWLSEQRLRRFRPQKHYLLILNLGDGTGLLSWRGLVLRSRWAFRFKDWLDRRFVGRYGA